MGAGRVRRYGLADPGYPVQSAGLLKETIFSLDLAGYLPANADFFLVTQTWNFNAGARNFQRSRRWSGTG